MIQRFRGVNSSWRHQQTKNIASTKAAPSFPLFIAFSISLTPFSLQVLMFPLNSTHPLVMIQVPCYCICFYFYTANTMKFSSNISSIDISKKLASKYRERNGGLSQLEWNLQSLATYSEYIKDNKLYVLTNKNSLFDMARLSINFLRRWKL